MQASVVFTTMESNVCCFEAINQIGPLCALNRQLCHPISMRLYVCVAEVRLAGDNSLTNAGRLEIYYNETWGTVCHNYFDDTDAQVACFMLGFG